MSVGCEWGVRPGGKWELGRGRGQTAFKVKAARGSYVGGATRHYIPFTTPRSHIILTVTHDSACNAMDLYSLDHMGSILILVIYQWVFRVP